MEGVAYKAICDPPSKVEIRSSHYAYCYLVRKGTLTLEMELPHPQQFTIEEGAIVSVSGLTSHRFVRESESPGMPQRLDQLLRPLGSCSSREIELIVGEVNNDTLAFLSAYVGVNIITEARSPLLHKRIWRTFELIEEELLHPLENDDVAVRLLSETILLNIIRSIREKDVSTATSLPGPVDRRILKAMMAIAYDPCRDWTVAELAALASMSRTAFAISFRKFMGATPMEVVTRGRLSRGIHALQNSSLPVEDVAALCGYGSSAAFVRVFKKEFGVTPARWRKGN